MKFLLVTPVYEGYLREFHATHPSTPLDTWQSSVADLMNGGFGASHIVAPYLRELGWDSEIVVTNDPRSQGLWLRENLPVGTPVEDWAALLRLQIEHIKPDVLYLLDPITYDSTFIRSLSFRPRFIVGWRAAAIPSSSDFSDFDLLLTNSTYCQRTLMGQGARRVERHNPGFPKELALRCGGGEPQWDLVFSGQWTPEHEGRNRLLLELSKAQLRSSQAFSLAYFLSWDGRHPMPSGVAMHDQGPRWGLEMYRTLRRGRATLHHPIDLSETEAPAMRIFEATGMGVPLFIQQTAGLNQYFEPGQEVVTYKTASDLVDKLTFLLRNPSALAAIGQRGQARCLRDHSMEARASDLDQLLRSCMNGGSRTISNRQEPTRAGSFAPPSSKVISNVVAWQKGCSVTVGPQHEVTAPPAIRSEDLQPAHFDRAASPRGVPLPYFPDVTLGTDVQILGLRNLDIGAGSCIGDHSWLNVCLRDDKLRMRIGRCVLIGRQSTISTGGYLEIGDYCLFGPRVTVIDADHGVSDIMRPYVEQPTTLNRSIVVEENCWLAVGAVVVGHLTVGRGSVVGANAVVLADVPPFCVVVGNPAQIVRMYDPVSGKWETAKTLEEQEKVLTNRKVVPLPTRSEYVEALRANARSTQIPPIVAGRGECL